MVLYVFIEILVYYELPRVNYMIKARNRITAALFEHITIHSTINYVVFQGIRGMLTYSLNMMSTYLNFNKKVIKKIKEK